MNLIPRCGCREAGACSCCDTSSDTVDTTGTGAPGNCYQHEVRIDPHPGNLIEVTDGGLMVDCDGVADCVGSPGEFPGVVTECGLNGDGTTSDPLGIDRFYIVHSEFQDLDGPWNLNGGQTAWVPLTVTNPSDCAPARAFVMPTASVRVNQSGGFAEVLIDTQVDGASTFSRPLYGHQGSEPNGAACGAGRARTPRLPPGGSAVIRMRLRGNVGGAGAGQFRQANLSLDGHVTVLVGP